MLDPNDVKVYNLSAGKSLPDWLSDRKRRALLNKDVDIRQRIELIQDFEMPGVSTSIRMSRDGNYIMAAGIYKPRIRCFEVDNLAMKFERCFDAEAVTFEILSDDYSKLVFLQCDRSIEFHAQYGRYHRLRIPKYGRDMKYHYPSCDLYLVGVSSDIYRLNLERGQFLNPFVSEGSELNKIAMNPVHDLIIVGTKEGRIEAWDPRARDRVSSLDCSMSCMTDNSIEIEEFPSVTALQFNGALTLGVGTATGQVLLYDIRSDKPFKVKDHMYGLPIKNIDFCQDQVLSMDSAILKIWNRNTGSLLTSIEAGNNTEFNDLCLVPNSGMMFMANESNKILTYYIPSLGPAPKWCGFLDSLTEELEESNLQTIYDDYKFVTKKELDDLGLGHLIGTNLLRAHMHGYFMDVRLYRKAKSIADPFTFEEYKRKKVREKIEEERTNRVQINKLPKINRELAMKLMEEKENEKNQKRAKSAGNLLQDNRFQALFQNPDFQVDTNAEEYRLLNPVLTRLDKSKKKQLKKHAIEEQFDMVDDEAEGKGTSDDSEIEYESSDDEKEWAKDVKKQHRLIKKEKRLKAMMEEDEDAESDDFEESEKPQPKFFELKSGEDYAGPNSINAKKENLKDLPLEERLKREMADSVNLITSNCREMTFTISKPSKFIKDENNASKHRDERKKLVRKFPSKFSNSKSKSKFFKGKR